MGPKRRLKVLDVPIGLVRILRTRLTFDSVRRAICGAWQVTHQFNEKEIKETLRERIRHGLSSMVGGQKSHKMPKAHERAVSEQ